MSFDHINGRIQLFQLIKPNLMKKIKIEKYKKSKDLGNGSFGCVYTLIDLNTSEKYAAKEFKFDEKNKSDNYSTFNQEIQCYLKTDNPSILKFYGYSSKNVFGKRSPIILLEYMKNSSLDKKLKENILSPTERYINLIGIAIGLKYLHSLGIVHRDIKPANILLNEKFQPKICDFGLSLISNVNLDHFYMSEIAGTPLYGAPEIYQNDYNYKVDVFSFSFIFYELLTKHELFSFKIFRNKFRLIKAIKKGLRPDLSVISDKNIQKFLEKCWSQNPSKRPSFSEIVNELLNERYRKFLKVNEKKVIEYLNLFNKDLLNPNKYKEFQYKNKQIYYINEKGSFILLIFFSFWIVFHSKITHKNKINYNENILASIIDESSPFCYYSANVIYPISVLKKLAEMEDPSSMYYYGMFLMNESTTIKSKMKAIQYFKKSAELGNKYAMYYYGLMLYEGKFIKKNKAEASKYFKLSADLGYEQSIYIYAVMNYIGDGISTDMESAAYYFKKSADLGNANAMFSYGSIMMVGDYIKKNETEAKKYFKKSADLGNPFSMCNYASMIKNDKKESMKYYKMCADNGNKYFKYEYAMSLIEENKEKESAFYLKQSADLGNYKAMYLYGNMLLNDDTKEAIFYIKKAAENGYSDAMFKYGQISI